MSVKLARSAGLISVATMASRVLGVAREMVLAAFFGASGGIEMDAFNVAFRIPNLLRDLFAEGAMTAAFVPTFTRTLTTEGREAAWRLGNLVINALLVITGFIVLIGIVFAAPITHAFAPWFADTPGKLELTTELTRIMLPFLATVAVAVAMMGMLNSLRRFFIPAFSPAMFNVATILCAFTLVPVMPRVGLRPIVAIALGTILGGIGQIALQWPVLRGEGFRYQPIIDFKDPKLLEVLRLMGPGTLGLAAVQINVFVNTYLATSQQQGSVSWLNYAFRLMYLPIGLFGVSIATAALPEIARRANEGDTAGMQRTISSALRMMLMLNVPATIGLIVLSEPIVALLLERGNFRPYDTMATAAALIFYSPGLLGYSAVKIASPSFYALRDSRTPVIVSVIAVLTNLTINLMLVRVMGYRGLALGTALAAMVNAGALLWLLRRRLGGLDERRVVIAFAKILAASVAMGIAARLTASSLATMFPPTHFLLRAVELAAAITVGVLVLAAAARLLRLAEFDDAFSRVLKRLRPSA
ncbi:MAG TPA: murein biosynthesis integral membrane protein MurJ [Vicinamibacterales bacterium]|nr:murein biosynthesis integral membrane protein MurJ [Vicinamibacterales bacterium]